MTDHATATDAGDAGLVASRSSLEIRVDVVGLPSITNSLVVAGLLGALLIIAGCGPPS